MPGAPAAAACRRRCARNAGRAARARRHASIVEHRSGRRRRRSARCRAVACEPEGVVAERIEPQPAACARRPVVLQRLPQFGRALPAVQHPRQLRKHQAVHVGRRAHARLPRVRRRVERQVVRHLEAQLRADRPRRLRRGRDERELRARRSLGLGRCAAERLRLDRGCDRRRRRTGRARRAAVAEKSFAPGS